MRRLREAKCLLSLAVFIHATMIMFMNIIKKIHFKTFGNACVKRTSTSADLDDRPKHVRQEILTIIHRGGGE